MILELRRMDLESLVSYLALIEYKRKRVRTNPGYK